MNCAMKLKNLSINFSIVGLSVLLVACNPERNEKLLIESIDRKEYPLSIVVKFKSAYSDIWEEGKEGKHRMECNFLPTGIGGGYAYSGYLGLNEGSKRHDYIVVLFAVKDSSSTSYKDVNAISEIIKYSKGIECKLFERNYFGSPRLNGSFTIPTRDILK